MGGNKERLDKEEERSEEEKNGVTKREARLGARS